MDAVGLMGDNIQHNPNLPTEYDDQGYALGGKNHCCVYIEEFLTMDRGTVRNM
jgi:hypothetical protein